MSEKYNIVLVCQNGASTDMLALKMEEAAKANNIDVIVHAHPAVELKDYVDAADIVLLAPQVRFKLNQFKAAYPNAKFKLVETTDYGMLRGEKVLNEALKELQ